MNEKIWGELKEFDFPENSESILALIERNLEKIEFVKDHAHLSNFVYIPEIKADQEHQNVMFAQFGDNRLGRTEEDFYQLTEEVIENEDLILEKMKSYFNQKEDVFYVEIGFVSANPKQEDYFAMHELLKEKKFDDVSQVIRNYKKYPDWYDGLFSEDIVKREENKVLIRENEKRLLLKECMFIVDEIDKAIDNNENEKITLLFQALEEVSSEMEKQC